MIDVGNVLSVCDGMSGAQIALNEAGITYRNYYASETDKFAIKVTQANYPQVIQLGDICKLKGYQLPYIGLMVGGFPCQSFSFAGKQLNFDDPRGQIFFQVVRLLKEVKPKYFLFENVRMKKEFQNVISNLLGVEPIMIDGARLSAQRRMRLYWTNIPGIEQPEDRKIYLQAIWSGGEDITRRVLLKKPGTSAFKNTFYSIKSLECKSNALTAQGQNVANMSCTNVKIGERYYKLTPLECKRLQGVPESFDMSMVSKTQQYKMLGNGFQVDTVKHIFSYMKPFKRVSFQSTLFELSRIPG